MFEEREERAETVLNVLFPQRTIERVLFVKPPESDDSLFNIATAKRRRYLNYPPYGLALLAHHLRKHKIEVEILNLHHITLKAVCESDSCAEINFDKIWKSALETAINRFKPDLVGVTCMYTMSHEPFKNVCRKVATMGIPIAIGGVYVTNHFEHVIDDIGTADFVFLNESDVAIQKFIQVVRRELPLSELSQFIICDGNRQILFSKPCRPSEKELDAIPAYDLLEISEYTKYGSVGSFYCFKPSGMPFGTPLSNRGCRAHCSFCSVRNFNGKGVRSRSVDSVVDEIELLRDKYGVGHISWLDDDLLVDQKRCISMFNEMVKRNLDITWDASNGVIASSCQEEVVAAAAESGCIAVSIGVESGNSRILRDIQKPGTVKTFLRAAEVFRRYPQIFANVFLMIGFPDETMSMIQDTINLSLEMNLDWYHISTLMPLPNTPIYDAMVEQGLVREVGSEETRWMHGPYGKQNEIESGQRKRSLDFEQSIRHLDPDHIPAPDQLNDVWFYMNYRLNFLRLIREEREIKIQQQLMRLCALSDVIANEHAFALYFRGYLQHKTKGLIDQEIKTRLKNCLSTSSFWSERFRIFGLKFEDLESGNFGKIENEASCLETVWEQRSSG